MTKSQTTSSPAQLLRTIVSPWLRPKTVTADEWCAAVDEYYRRVKP